MKSLRKLHIGNFGCSRRNGFWTPEATRLLKMESGIPSPVVLGSQEGVHCGHSRILLATKVSLHKALVYQCHFFSQLQPFMKLSKRRFQQVIRNCVLRIV